MRVAFIHQPWNDVTPPVEAGSIAIWTDRVARRMAAYHEVSVYGRAAGERLEENEVDGVRYIHVPAGNYRWHVRFLQRTNFLRKRTRPYYATPAYFGAYTHRVAQELARGGAPDVVHLHNLSQMVPPIRRLNPDARIVLHMHCEWLAQLDRRLLAPRVEAADALLGCSGHITRGIRSAFPDVATRCHTVYNGVDRHVFAGGERPAGKSGPCVLFVGRISPEKGLHVLLDAFREVARQVPDARLLIVGPESVTPPEFLPDCGLPAFRGSYLQWLKSRVPAHLASRVTFTGFVPHGRLRALYREADVLVNPSFSESFGMSLIEAMSCEAPVVATRVGGMPEVVEDRRTGRLVQPGDPGAIAAAVLEILRDAGRRAEMGRAARRRVCDRFAWGRVAADLAALYARIQPCPEPR